MSLFGLLATVGKTALKTGKTIVKAKINEATKPITDLKSAFSNLSASGSKTGESNVGISQILGGAQQAQGGQTDLAPLNNLKMMMDKGFYGHMKVKGTKSDASKWAKL